jgi:ABC-type amino acid transport substrate-binding protein
LRLYLAALGAIAALLLLILLLRPSAQLLNAPEIARAQRLGVLRVGVLSDAPGFCVLNGGGGDGLEIALAHRLAKKIFRTSTLKFRWNWSRINQYTALPSSGREIIDIRIRHAMQRAAILKLFLAYTLRIPCGWLCRSGEESCT